MCCELGLDVDDDGVRIAALLVARLRFERLMQGSNEAARFFEEAPDAFAASFRGYHESTRALAQDPAAEGAQFLAWNRDRDPGES